MFNTFNNNGAKVKYLKKPDERSMDKKKVVGARVSEVVLTALSAAAEDVQDLGYNFSITKVIEQAFNDALYEVEQVTGVDYYKLAKWERSMRRIHELAGTELGDEYWDDILNTIKLTASHPAHNDFAKDCLEYMTNELIYKWNEELHENGSKTRFNLDPAYGPDPIYGPNSIIVTYGNE